MTSAWNLWAAQCLIDECIRFDIDHFFIAPGSRSAPLTLAVERHPSAKWMTHFDERGIGFLALGFARANARAAAVITTSGSAVANLLPAVVEASQAGTGLLLLTADRPPELIDCGANQAIRQPGIFSHFVNSSVNLSAPDAEFSPSALLLAVDAALKQTSGGPVHINCPFREPLYPSQLQPFAESAKGSSPWPDLSQCPGVPRRWLSGAEPYYQTDGECSLQLGKQQASKQERCNYKVNANITATLVPGNLGRYNGIIIAGQLTFTEAQSLVHLGRLLQWPILADLHSHCRSLDDSIVFSRYGLWLNYPQATEILGRADLILQFGARITDKHLQHWLRELAPTEHWLVANSDFCPDPDRRVTRWVREEVSTTIAGLIADAAEESGHIAENSLITELAEVEQTCEKILGEWFSQTALTEVAVCRRLSSLLPITSQCFVGNSLPIRILDLIGANRNVHWYSQRGASGIDGIVAHAYGIHLAGMQPTTLLIGDMSLLHDLNSLSLLSSLRHNASRKRCKAGEQVANTAVDVSQTVTAKVLASFIIVVINNNGGNIFRFLPVDESQRTELFQTPHGFSFAKFCEGFEVNYMTPHSLTEFSKAYEDALKSSGSTVIEILTEENGAFNELVELRKLVKQKL